MKTEQLNDDAWQDKLLGILGERVSQVVVRSHVLSDSRRLLLAARLEMAAKTLRTTALQNATAATRSLWKASRYEEVRDGLVEPVAPPRDA